MNAGYVRLSRDDDKRNYISIENQKLIITQFAAERNLVIDRWYEDDGFSGYTFDRPGFQQLMKDLQKDITCVFVKDFSRLGRHNAKVLLLLDEFQEHKKRLLIIDDNYDSLDTEDDTIGIKTWYNERYVKDTSKKIKRALGARQKEGTLITQPPFGYIRNATNHTLLEIVPKEAAYIKTIYDLYLKGFGYRKIANYLTTHHTPTPSMIRHERELKAGNISKRKVTAEWSDSMVKDILANDFYIGTLRLRKRARSTIHGKDKRVSPDQQYIFENHHPAIIDKTSFVLIQELKKKRKNQHERSSHKQQMGSKNQNLFGDCLFCKDCGRRLTPIRRNTSSGERQYYICNTYNTKGKRYCSKAHLIEEKDLIKDVIAYMKLCRNALSESIMTYDIKNADSKQNMFTEQSLEIQTNIKKLQKQLKMLFAQKIRDLSLVPHKENLNHILKETYDALQEDLLSQIHKLELQLQKLKDTNSEKDEKKETFQNALQMLDQIIEKKFLNRKDLAFLIERIEIDKEGLPEIQWKYALCALISPYTMSEPNQHENTIIYHIMRLIMEEKRTYTSAKYLSKALTDSGYPKSSKSVLPYIRFMIESGILEPNNHSSKPYTIVKTKEELQEIMQNFYKENFAFIIHESQPRYQKFF